MNKVTPQLLIIIIPLLLSSLLVIGKSNTIQDECSKHCIEIQDIGIEEINSADGVKFYIDWTYFNKNKKIKYIYFTCVPYNGVDDKVQCNIGGHISFEGKVTGPIEGTNGKMNPHISYWENAWYNSTVECIKVTKVKAQYTDGSQYVYINELPKILSDNIDNSCEYEK